MRILNVAEKPAMARQIASLLSSNSFTTSDGKNKYCKNFEFQYNLDGRSCSMIMTSVLGHVKELDFSPEYGNWSLTPPYSLFEAEVFSKVSDDKKGIVQNLQIQGRQAQMLVIWTDCDREGEHIGSEIVEICHAANSRLDIYRARYSAVTQYELKRAMSNLQRLDLKQVAAVEARCELDLRSGAIFTRYQTLRLRDNFPSIDKEIISYGPCQFPTLGFVVEQYLKVLRFRPEPFWYLDLQIAKDDETNKFTWKRNHLFDRLITLILYEKSIEMSSGQARIVKVEEKQTCKYRPLPLRTVEFQKAASRFLKISSDQVMSLAEKLYNRGFISYPRTETDVFEFSAEQLRTLVQKQTVDGVFGEYAQGLLNSDGLLRMPRKGKNNDKAHPPIHPTSSGEELSGQERAVFEFVARRFLACCSDDAKGLETKITAQVGVEEFECKGIRVTELNYLRVYKYEKWAEQEIAPFRQGEMLPIKEYLMKDGSTSAPLLLSESDLITCMDKNGIGTDATIHEHIQKILARRYALKTRDSRFIPTRLGAALVEAFDMLGLDFSLTQPKIRAKLEKDLTRVCAGTLTKDQVIAESKEMYKKVYKKVEDEFERLMRVFRKYLSGGSRNGGGNGNNGSGYNGSNGYGSNHPDDDDNSDLPPGNPFDSMPLPKQSKRNLDDEDEDSSVENTGKKKRTRSTSTKSTAKTRTVKPKTSTRTSTKSNDSLSSVPAPNCLCSLPASKRTVSKDGPNKGKQFWGCSKDFNAPDNCKFFEWVMEICGSVGSSVTGNSITGYSGNANAYTGNKSTYKGNPSSGYSGSTASSTGFTRASNTNIITINSDVETEAEPDDGDGELRCKCGLIMTQDVMKTGKDAGRKFAKCPRIVQRCGTFIFLDSNTYSNTSSNTYSTSSNTNRTSNNTNRTYPAASRKPTSTVKKQKCFKCNKTGHWANACPN